MKKNNHYDTSLTKDEILDTINSILEVLSHEEDFRPRMSDKLRADIDKIKKEATIPKEIENDLREHEMNMSKFMRGIDTICETKFPKEYKRLKEKYPQIVKMVLRDGEHADLITLRRRLDLGML